MRLRSEVNGGRGSEHVRGKIWEKASRARRTRAGRAGGGGSALESSGDRGVRNESWMEMRRGITGGSAIAGGRGRRRVLVRVKGCVFHGKGPGFNQITQDMAKRRGHLPLPIFH